MGGVEVYLQAFLTSGQDGSEWSALRPGRFVSANYKKQVTL
jgi:hypothetical protein